MREVGAASCVFYVAVVVIGRLLMANVVLASLLNESTNLYTDVLETKKRLRHVMYPDPGPRIHSRRPSRRHPRDGVSPPSR